MKVYLATLGCRLNEAEIESWARQLQANGHVVASTPQQAQVIVLNTCAVTSEAARKSRQFVNRLHRLNTSAPLVVTGCYAELEADKAAQLLGVDLVVGNRQKESLVEILNQQFDWHSMPLMAMEPESTPSFSGGRTRAFVKVQDGCRNRCTFCIVTIARGEERSRPLETVIDEINELHRGGYQEVVLTGVHLGGYGSDLGSDLRTLVRTILDNTDIPRLRLSSLEPWDLPEDFFMLWQNPRLMPHLHLPLQSGCDATLRRMARRCDTQSYAALVEKARAAIPDLTLTTDLIVGFPGETEIEWRTTIDFVQQIGFAHMHIFSFSPREGTTAARLRGMVPVQVKKQRSREIHALAADMKAAFLQQALGQMRPVLWEKSDSVSQGMQRRWTGYTDNYLRVEAVVPVSVQLENKIAPAILTALLGEPPDRIQALLADAQIRVGKGESVARSGPRSTSQG